MTPADLEQLTSVAAALQHFKRIGVFSAREEATLFPKATNLRRWRWDLNKPGNRRYDLLVASNVFMYSPQPALWFRHVFACCRYFLMVDIVRRRRGTESEFGSDGCCMRFAIGDSKPEVDGYFDLNQFSDRLLGFRIYDGTPNQLHERPQHFIALFKGDLSEPVLRVDDFPTGIRPLLPDLTPIYDVLKKIEDRGLNFHLGIVPALLDDAMAARLREFQHLVPTVHGYDHGYFRLSPQLIQANDPFNHKTITRAFDEFAGVPYELVHERLHTGRVKLEQVFETPVTKYIPPCNHGSRMTAKALKESGYTHYLSDKRLPGCELPLVTSDFYGRSSDYTENEAHNVLTLHATWEWDVIRNGNLSALDAMLDSLAARVSRTRQQDKMLSALFN